MSKAKEQKVTMEKCRQQIAKQYKEKIQDLENQVKRLTKENDELKDERSELEKENADLKDWVERMLEYTNMDKETLEKAKKNLEAQSEISESMKNAMGILGFMFKGMNF